MKESIKKIKCIYRPLRYLRNEFIKYLTLKNPILASKYLFKSVMGYELNLKNPKTFNEKIQWLKLFEENETMIKCGDKYGVRDYAKSKGLDKILCDLYGVYKSVDEIDFNSLPEKFVLKVSNSSGQNIIVNSKKDLNVEIIKNKIKKWQDEKFGLYTAEPHYQKMDSKIICEEYLEDIEKKELEDYKIYCFNGKPLFLMLCTGRARNQTKYYFYDLEWQPLNYNKHTDNLIKGIDDKVNEPKNLSKMYEYAKELSQNIKFVRVDFYNISGRILLGEMTFTPCGGLDKNLSREVDILMGEMIKI